MAYFDWLRRVQKVSRPYCPPIRLSRAGAGSTQPNGEIWLLVLSNASPLVDSTVVADSANWIVPLPVNRHFPSPLIDIY